MMPRQGLSLVIIPQQRRVENLGYVAKPWDLVGTRTAREELAGARPEGFLEGEEAETLNESAFDLAVVDGGVDGLGDVLGRVLAY
jgi:hypothetical protein